MSLNTHATNITGKTNKRRIGKNIVGVPGEDQFEFRKEKLTTNASGMQGIISARTLHVVGLKRFRPDIQNRAKWKML